MKYIIFVFSIFLSTCAISQDGLQVIETDFLEPIGDGNYWGIAYVNKDSVFQCNGAVAIKIKDIKSTMLFNDEILPNMVMIGVKTNDSKTEWALFCNIDIVTGCRTNCQLNKNGIKIEDLVLGLLNGVDTVFYYEVGAKN